MSFVIASAVAVFIIVIMLTVLFPGPMKAIKHLLNGLGTKLVQDVAQTPEGAEAYFNEAIREYEERYNKVSDILREYTGVLETTKQDLERFLAKVRSIEKQCETLVSRNQVEDANTLAGERENILTQIKSCQNKIAILEPQVNETKVMYTEVQTRLKALKQKKNQVVSELKLNKEAEKIYDDFDSLKNTTELDRMMAAVDEGYKKSTSRAIGARTLYNESQSTKVTKAIGNADKLQTSSYIDELKKKYQK